MRITILSLLAASAAAAVPVSTQPRFVPSYTTDFPDPFILPWGGGYFAYGTNARGFAANIQMAISRDMKTWTPVLAGGRLHDALPVLPKWAAPGRTWAPEVLQIGNRYLLYFTALERSSGVQCVGVGESTDPRGPFRSVSETPLVCQRSLGGTIDPSPFRDKDGSLHLLFKSDGNNPRVLVASRIWSQPMAPDGLSLTGKPTELIRNDVFWEWRVVESPTMVRDPEGRYVLLYSANHFGWESDQRLSNYAMGYARCASITGPCVKAPENPILKSYNTADGCLSGPGHQAVFTVAAKPYLVFHAWSANAKCRSAEKGRFMYIAPLDWRDGTPAIAASVR